MIRRLAALVVILALAFSPAALAASQGNNALGSTDASATVTLTIAADTLFFANDGANAVYVKPFSGCETAAAITTATSGALKVNPGEKVTFPPVSRCGLGIISFSHICAAGLTTTSRWFAQ